MKIRLDIPGIIVIFNPFDPEEVWNTVLGDWVVQAGASLANCSVDTVQVGDFYYVEIPVGLDGLSSFEFRHYPNSAVDFSDLAYDDYKWTSPFAGAGGGGGNNVDVELTETEVQIG